MTYKGFVKNISLNWRSRKPEITLELDARAEDIEKLKDVPLSVDLKRYREKRSLDANAYYWTLISKIAEAIGQTKPWLHNDMLRKYGQIEIIDGNAVYLVLPDTETAFNRAYEAETYHVKPTSQVKSGKDGKMFRTYIMLRGSHDYDTKEMSTLIDGAVQEAKQLGIETMTPEQIERMMADYEKHIAKR